MRRLIRRPSQASTAFPIFSQTGRWSISFSWPRVWTQEGQHRISQEDLQLRPEQPKELREHAERSSLCRNRGVVQFDSKGNVARLPMMGPQKRDQFRETQANYLRAKPGAAAGDTNPGVRLALYFQRKAGEITSAYDILADKALSEVFRTTFDLPDFDGLDADRSASQGRGQIHEDQGSFRSGEG